ncbi:hypothetical protein QWY99_22115 [Flavobacterium branchiarum]|uniref:Mu-like prophage I protein n=1 Tax=Flavobacterium branchiarum TaxID=1114870 RepID=A0ABV5FSK8_9FLAO|nr:hypothetical protein [Flavobacterium branchiarum]MDN3671500.1 hypothetical protein [Flavobacterium branchiarum]MDN3672623.1 hypothetical protein [Flavobacterium branchiarum]MDN3675733.1 hypothetical protein [Flavobacterium branchiarum]
MSTPKQKKIDKEFCITDDSVNVYGYRCLTSGLLVDEVKKNPIGFKMHNRDNGVVVRWEDFRIDNDKVYAKPIINLAHPQGETIVSEIENGFLNAASVGKIVVLDYTDLKSLMLPDQTGPTITKWFPREISLVDIPGNYNALADLFDIDDNELNLSDLKKTKPNNMKKIILTAGFLTALNLSDNSSDEDANGAFQDLIDKANKIPGLQKDLADKTKALTEKEKELSDLKDSHVAKEVQDLLSKGEADKKLTKEVSAKLGESFKADPKGLKDLIDAMPAQTLITDQLGDNKDASVFAGKKWDDLYQSDQLETVRIQLPDLYDKLKKEKYPNS